VPYRETEVEVLEERKVFGSERERETLAWRKIHKKLFLVRINKCYYDGEWRQGM